MSASKPVHPSELVLITLAGATWESERGGQVRERWGKDRARELLVDAIAR